MTTLIVLKGSLDFDTVPIIWSQVLGQFKKEECIQLNFSDVTDCNSAALALVLECFRQADKSGKKIKIINPPQRLMDIAATCGISGILENCL